MLNISNLCVSLAETDQQILSKVNITINPGEVHLLRGRNGSGKSTLASTVMGDPRFKVTSGSISLKTNIPDHLVNVIGSKDKINLLELEPHQRSLAGIFLANQYPLEIPGLNLSHFLRTAYNLRQEKDLSVFKFRSLLKERAKMINYPEHLLDRNLNEGFSGGEKKKTEILQMAVLEPKIAILDETDSGLDKQAIIEVFEGIRELRKNLLPDLSLILITHYDKVLEIIPPDFTHEIKDGEL